MLGFVFSDLDLHALSAKEFKLLRCSIPKHGVVCIKDQKLEPHELISLTKKFGDPVLLPEGLRFNNTEKKYPELARVSNILPDGTRIKNHQAAEYWHVDGDFWQPGQNYIFNFLYSVVVPEQGGETAFIDLRKAYDGLNDEFKEKISSLSFVSSCAAIPDFQVASSEEYLPDAHHAVEHRHVETGRLGLYINYPTTKLDGMSQEMSERFLSALFEQIDIEENRYVHCWEAGDILIWDNTSVMHRSLGGYGNFDRLLYRTQAFIQSV